MDHFKFIYQNRAGNYHTMIHAEDRDGNLLRAIQKQIPLNGKIMLDLGAGTGRLAQLLAPLARVIFSLDIERAMLDENLNTQRAAKIISPPIHADMRRLPIRNQCCDLTTAGWAIGHFCGWHPADWKVHIRQVLSEMERVTKAGGHNLILETMGTGMEQAMPPTPELSEYYRMLVEEWDFKQQVISTDYQFPTAGEAAEALEFFFGPELAETIRQNQWARVPEWTGLWIRDVPQA